MRTVLVFGFERLGLVWSMNSIQIGAPVSAVVKCRPAAAIEYPRQSN
jgi:hypothetical protein